MKQFQIVERQGKECHAGPKAIHDASMIAANMGFSTFHVSRLASTNKFISLIGRLLWILKMPFYLLRYPKNGVMFLQFPQTCLGGKLGRLLVNRKVVKKRNLKVVTLIHDVETLRTECVVKDNPFGLLLQNIVDASDIMVVHNRAMLNWFVQHGVEVSRLVPLEIFDYLASSERRSPPSGDVMSIAVAGNLQTRKCGYLSGLSKVTGVKWFLYGPNYNHVDIKGDNVEYRGCLQPDDAPNVIDGGWGLVWDGDSVDSCVGPYGNYLRYNNPHKLSLYLAAGMPVVIWKEAAEAEFVLRENVGIAVGSLKEIPGRIRGLGTSEYEKMKSNARSLPSRLRDGHFLKTALNEAGRRIEAISGRL